MRRIIYTLYKVTNRKNGRTYYGCTSWGKGRIMRHERDLGRGVHANHEMQQDWNDGNFEFSYEILGTTTCYAEAREFEEERMNEDPLSYNMLCCKHGRSTKQALNKNNRNYVLAEVQKRFGNPTYTVARLHDIYEISVALISGLRNGKTTFKEPQTSFRDVFVSEDTKVMVSNPLPSYFLQNYCITELAA